MALRWWKCAVAPQLSVSPIWAYGPARARSPQTTMGDFAAAPPEPPEPEPEEPQAARLRMLLTRYQTDTQTAKTA